MQVRERVVLFAAIVCSVAALQPTAMQIPAVPSLTGAEVVAQVKAAGLERTGIIGFGSLLSSASASSTCPGVTNFRLGRVRGWRRVFGHPAHIFFQRGIARPATKEIASLCAEPSDDPTSSFTVGKRVYFRAMADQALSRFTSRRHQSCYENSCLMTSEQNVHVLYSGSKRNKLEFLSPNSFVPAANLCALWHKCSK
jgi:hypothetical protein